QPFGYAVARLDPRGRRVLLPVGAHLRPDADLALRRRPAPAHVVGADDVDAEQLLRAYDDGVGAGVGGYDIPRGPVGRRDLQAQPAALPDRVAVRAPVLAQARALVVDDRAGALAETAGQPASRVAVGDEADVVAV